jgi:hypothetical protein
LLVLVLLLLLILLTLRPEFDWYSKRGSVGRGSSDCEDQQYFKQPPMFPEFPGAAASLVAVQRTEPGLWLAACKALLLLLLLLAALLLSQYRKGYVLPFTNRYQKRPCHSLLPSPTPALTNKPQQQLLIFPIPPTAAALCGTAGTEPGPVACAA